MKNLLIKIWGKVRAVGERYPVLVAALVIYLYYLFTSVNLFEHHKGGESWVDYIMQFDSLFFLWIAAAAFLQIQKYRKRHKQEDSQRKDLERVVERQQIYSTLINDVTYLMQDTINNPLGVISATAQEIRHRFEHDTEILRWIDRIEAATTRIAKSIRDIQVYETQKMVDSTSEILKK